MSRYWKFDFTAGHGTAIMVQEIEMFLTSSLSPDVTTGITAVTANGQSNGAALNVLDNTGAQWQHNAAYPHWLKIDFGANNNQLVYAYKITGPSQTAYPPTAWTLKQSLDDITYTTVSTVTGQTGWTASEVRTFYTTFPYKLVGTTLDAAGDPVSRLVRVHLRSSGIVLASVTSTAGTGAWRVDTYDQAQYFAVLHDATSGSSENAVILDGLTPVSA